MHIIANTSHPSGKGLTAPSYRRPCACPLEHGTSIFERKGRLMRQLAVARRFSRQPLMEVLGLLLVAGVAKSGYGLWAAGGILTLVPIYFGAAVLFTATRYLAVWVARMRLCEQAKL